MPSIFPLEIEEMILDILAKDEDDELILETLKTCSLVCQAFLPICRTRIFGSIYLDSSNIHAFQRLLRETPEIAGHIRELDCNITEISCLTTSSTSIQESLKRISKLESLTLQHHYKVISKAYKPVDWSNNPIRPALLHLLHLPTLIYFTVSDVYDFVLSDLIPCVNLKYLNIGNTTVAAENTFPMSSSYGHHAAGATFPKHSIQLNEFATAGNRIATELCIARLPSGRPIIDLGSLSKLTVFFFNDALMELFRHCHALTNVDISFVNPRNVSLADMLRPSMQTLKHIVLDIYVLNVHVDPLLGISSDLEVMRTKNIIESVTIRIIVRTDADFRRGDDWGRFDEVLTVPGWVSLKQVSLAIDINRDNNELEVVLGKLPETHFSRLSSSNSVSFDFKVENSLEGIIL